MSEDEATAPSGPPPVAPGAPPGAPPGRREVALAWGVHAFTASGAIIALVALLAISAGELVVAAALMLVALVIDSVDGTLARRVGVAEVLPQIDGRRLDDIVDFLNYVIVPAAFIVAAGNVPSWLWVALPVLASAYGFAQEDAKTDDDFFLGFPSYWNVVAIYLWGFALSPAVGAAILTVLAIAVFVPLKYIYPSKLRHLANTTNVLGGIWLAMVAVAILDPAWARGWHLLRWSLFFPAWYLGLSFVLGGFHRSEA